MKFIDEQDREQIRRGRDRFTIEIRKKNRHEIFKKLRGFEHDDSEVQQGHLEDTRSKKLKIIVDEQYREMLEEIMEERFDFSQVEDFCDTIENAGGVRQIHRAVIGLRMIICEQFRRGPTDTIVKRGLVGRLVDFMQCSKFPQLQIEACWIITNIACGQSDHCEQIIENGGLPVLCQLLLLKNSDIVVQAIWAIGNLAGDNSSNRDALISLGTIESLIRLVQNSKSRQIIRQGAWALCNFSRGKPLPEYELVKSLYPVLCRTVISGVQDDENLAEILWAISYGCEGGSRLKIQAVLNTGVVPNLVALCRGNLIFLLPSLRTLGNISNGSDQQTGILLQAGLLDLLHDLLYHHVKVVRREACWVLSNVCAGTETHVQQVIEYDSLMKQVGILLRGDQADVKRQICFIFSNLTLSVNTYRVANIIDQFEVVKAVAKLLDVEEEEKTLEVALQCLNTLLDLGEVVKKHLGDNIFLLQLQVIPQLSHNLEQLQYHESKLVYQKTVILLKNYFKVLHVQEI